MAAAAAVAPTSHTRSSHLTTHSNGLHLLDVDINHPPIKYPSPSPSIKQRVSSGRSYPQKNKNTVEEIVDDDNDDEWELEREYVDVNAADATAGYGIDPYLGIPARPYPIHRDSQDVEFGNRLTPTRRMRMSGRSRGRGWEVHVRLPHVKGLSRGKTAFLKTLRGGLARVHSAGHSSSNSHSPPTFEFRDPQPMPQSIRQQYAELAPADSAPAPAPVPSEKENRASEMRTENGLLAPPVPTNGPSPAMTSPRTSSTGHDAESVRRHSRSQSASYHSQSQTRTSRIQTPRPRSRSVASRRSASSQSTVAAHTSQSHGDGVGTAETTLVQHITDAGLMPLYRTPSKVPKSSMLNTDGVPQRSNTLSSVRELRVPNPVSVARSRSQHTRRSTKPKSSLVRALQAFQRLPWIANPEYPPGALMPTGSPPRIAKDFVPSLSARAKLREKTAPGTGIVYAKNGVDAGGLEEEEKDNPSWYKPGTRQIQRSMRTQYAQRTRGVRSLTNGIGHLSLSKGGMGPVKQAYASYRVASGRPMGYMYASPMPSRSVSSGGGAPPYSAMRHQYSGHPRAGGGSAGVCTVPRSASSSVAGSGGRGQIAAAASAYLSRSASASQVSTPATQRRGSGYMTNVPSASASDVQTAPPVPPKVVTAQPVSQQQQSAYNYNYPSNTTQNQVQYYTYNFAYPQAQPYTRSRVPGSSPPLPPVPPPSSGYAHSSHVRSQSYPPSAPSASGHSHHTHHTQNTQYTAHHIPTIPSIPSQTPSSSTHVSSSYSHGSGGSASASVTMSGYGSVIAQGPHRYMDYSYSYLPR